MSDARVRFGILGPVQLTIDGVDRPLGGPKQRATLAYLVLNANRPVAVESLTRAVWADNPPPDARVSLHTIVSNLRKPLRDAGFDARAVLSQIGAGYRISVADAACDVDRFRAGKERGLRALAEGRFDAASAAVTEALREWRGPALADLRGFEFAQVYATALDDERIGAIEARAAADLARDRVDAVVAELTVLVGEYPLRERLWKQLITALYLNGRQSDALEAARRLRATLAGELGIDPSPSIQLLEGRILRQEPLIVRAATASDGSDTVVEQSIPVRAAVLRDSRGHTYPLCGPRTKIGRSPENDIVLDHGKVSRKHAVIVFDGVAYIIRDLLSVNGIRVNGVRIVDSAALADGDVIRIGDCELTLHVAPLAGA
ncbi:MULTISPECIES: BTAD domain-containing putative transcriptional regulator [unclassified Nocardia]|uniref:BTAD domain-containing putative transcriptional regulator n=1 Tax=unclassified Nocardia TaxID=2637762 RepID=UPI001CE3D137|nr:MULTISPECIES: BTAD domain-containing putative transcriptional regulator [unclassified Nocardia]